MSSFSSIIFSLLLATFASAGDLPWIGVSLGYPSSEERQESNLNEGVGLKVTHVVPGGPLAQAGGREGDLWAKFDEQILINKRQMYVLLRSKSPGDTVKVQCFRDGDLKVLSLTLRKNSAEQKFPVSKRSSGPNTSRILAKREQVARLAVEDQTLTLQREGDGWRFMILKDEEVVLSSLVFKSDLNEKVPSKWHDSFLILRLTLEQQVQTPLEDRETRVRYFPREKTSEKSN